MIRTINYREPGSDCDVIEGPTRSSDEEIKRLEITLKLKRQHNSAALVAKLPPEVLSHVFELVASTDDPDRDQIYRYKWLNVSHICSHWRQVALGSTNLWKRITLNAPAWWVEDLLCRSKKAPLTVEVDLQYPCIRDFTPVSPHIPRIRHLSISAPRSETDVGRLFPDIPPVANLLESFSVRLAYNTSVFFRLPENLFAGGTPRLRQLELHNCDLDWKSPFLSGLTSLILASTSRIPSMPEFISALQSMPNLEVLCLDGNFPLLSDTTGPGPSVHEPTPLQRLSDVTIQGARVTDCLHVLNQFAFPLLSILKLDLEGTRHPSDLASLRSVVSRLVNDESFGTRCQIRRLNAYCFTPGLTRFEGWGVANGDLAVEDHKETFHFFLRLKLLGQQPADMCRSLVGILPLENLRCLGIHNFGIIDWSLFGRLRSLQRLFVSGGISDSGLVQALATEIPSAQQESPGEREGHPPVFYFPSLRELTLLEWANDTGRDVPACFDRLILAMVKRKRCQLRIPELTLGVREILPAQEKRLREVVDTLTIQHLPENSYI